jgi:hypothetical protein
MTGLSGTATYTLSTPNPPACVHNGPPGYVADGTWTAGFKLLPAKGAFPHYQVGEERRGGRRIPSGTMGDVRVRRTDTTRYTYRSFDTSTCATTDEPCSTSQGWTHTQDLPWGIAPDTRKFAAAWPTATPLEGDGCYSAIGWSDLGRWVGFIDPKHFKKNRVTIRWHGRAEGDRVFHYDFKQHFVAEMNVTATLRRVR